MASSKTQFTELNKVPGFLEITRTDKPVFVYYCKAFKSQGDTVMIDDPNTGLLCHVPGASFAANYDGQFAGSMIDGNSKRDAKTRGARCVFELKYGRLMIHKTRREIA